MQTLIERAQKHLDASTPESARMYRRADRVLVGGVASSFQRRVPWPFYLTRGEGAIVWDLDGRRMVDFHNGFGSMVQGHANPADCRRGRQGRSPTGVTSRRRPRTR